MDQEFSIEETENARALLLRGEILREEETTVCANCVTGRWLKERGASIAFLQLATVPPGSLSGLALSSSLAWRFPAEILSRIRAARLKSLHG